MTKSNTEVLIFGGRGFIGRNLKEALASQYDVYSTTQSVTDQTDEFQLDLRDEGAIKDLLDRLKPEVIINCAGIVDASQDVTLNETYTHNILQAVVDAGLSPERIIICGSAGEYGNVHEDEIPVGEHVPLRAQSAYGMAKVAEESVALEYAQEHHLPVVVARIFNPVGADMGEKFLISRLIKQLGEYATGERSAIEISRKDSLRDYVAIEDVVSALSLFVSHKPKERVYNIGSGKSTSNADLVQMILQNSKLESSPPIVETATEPELPVASQADISRLSTEFDWQPTHSIADTIKETMNERAS